MLSVMCYVQLTAGIIRSCSLSFTARMKRRNHKDDVVNSFYCLVKGLLFRDVGDYYRHDAFRTIPVGFGNAVAVSLFASSNTGSMPLARSVAVV